MDMFLNLLKALATFAKTLLELYERWRERKRKTDDVTK